MINYWYYWIKGKRKIEIYRDFHWDYECCIYTQTIHIKLNAFCVIVGPIRAENGSQGDDQPATQQNDGEERVIFVNAPHQPAKYKNNHITTAKYSFLSFVPLFLFEQFRRYSNCFFLFIALMQVKFIALMQKYYECNMMQRMEIWNSLIILFYKYF